MLYHAIDAHVDRSPRPELTTKPMTHESTRPLAGEPAKPAPTDGRRVRGMRSRAAVLERAVQMASCDGLEGLTIGALSAELGIHKSSVLATFGSKEELQLATLATARSMLIEQVVMPALAAPEGAPRLLALGEAWCDYFGSDVFAGGCFLCAASSEMDGRPGPVRDAVAAVMREWLAVLTTNIEAAAAAGDLRPDTDPAALAFRLNALGMAANWQQQLLDDPAGVEHARAGWQQELRRHTPDPQKPPKEAHDVSN
jgi:AcrR family transcriptional regulator